MNVFFVVKCLRKKPKSFFKFFQIRAVFFRADDVLLRFSHFPCSAQGSVPRHGVALLFCLRLGGVRPELPYFLEAAKRERALAFARLGPPPAPTRSKMKNAQPMAAAPPGQLLLLHQVPPRRCLKKSASAATLLGGGAVAASRYLLQEELGRGASGQVSIAYYEFEKTSR